MAISAALQEGLPLRQLADRYSCSIASLSRHNTHSRAELAVFAPGAEPAGRPHGADPASPVLDFITRMESVLATTQTVQAAARNSGSASMLLAGARAEQAAVEALRRAVGINPSSVQLQLELAGEVTKAIGYISGRSPAAAQLLVDYFRREGINPKSSLSDSTRADLGKLAERLASIHHQGGDPA